MKTSERGLKLITQREGKIMHVYRDSQGYPTAGVGHLLTASEKKSMPVGTPITEQQCRDWLVADLGKCEDAVNNVGKLKQNEFDALVSLSFNIGVGGFNKSTIVRRLKSGDHKGAAEAILFWNKPPEIQGRRRGEYHQFLTPYPYSAAIPSQGVGSSADNKSQNSATDPANNNQELPPSDPTTTVESTQTTVETPQGLSTATVTTATTTEPVTVKAVAVGLWTKIIAGFTALTAMGINLGTVIETKLSEITLNQVFIMALGVGLAIAVLFYYRKRQEAADLKTHLLIAAAADKDRHTIHLMK